MKTVDNIICDRSVWVEEVSKRFPNAEFQRGGNWVWAILDGEDIAMHSIILGGGWIKKL